jgi:hypothetical protein
MVTSNTLEGPLEALIGFHYEIASLPRPGANGFNFLKIAVYKKTIDML